MNMAKKSKSSISVLFVSPVDSLEDKSQVRAAYDDLRTQITSLAESIAVDRNVIISHSTVNRAGEAPSQDDPVDTKIAELQTIGTRIDQGKSVAVNPGYKPKFEIKNEDAPVEDEFEEKPRVKAGGWTPPTKTTPTKVSPPIPEAGVTPATSESSLKTRMEEVIFKDLKKSAKSTAIIDYMLDNMDKQFSPTQIAEGSGIDVKAVSIWLSTTAKQINAIKNVERGVYTFISDKIKLKD